MAASNEETLVYRLRKRAEIRRHIQTRKSVQEGKADRIADLLEEAAVEIERLQFLSHPCEICEDFDEKEPPEGIWWACAKCYNGAQSQQRRLMEALVQWDRLPMYDDIKDRDSYRVDRSELADVEALTAAALSEFAQCTVYKYECPVHHLFHGQEAEEIRSKLEVLLENAENYQIPTIDLVILLDSVDARDSLAYLESRDNKP